jgi:hypothetical protein
VNAIGVHGGGWGGHEDASAELTDATPQTEARAITSSSLRQGGDRRSDLFGDDLGRDKSSQRSGEDEDILGSFDGSFRGDLLGRQDAPAED